jgi:hypothetical protein
MKTFAPVLFAAISLASLVGCSRDAKPVVAVNEARPMGAVVVYVTGHDGLPGRVAMTSGEDSQSRDMAYLRKNGFVTMPATGKQRLIVPTAGTAIDVDVKEGEHVFVRLSYKNNRFVFDRVDEREAAQEMTTCTSVAAASSL